jgi:hypothetical protein
MESNGAKRRFRFNTLVAGVLGVAVGVLAMMLIPSLLRAQEPLNSPASSGLTVTLHFKRGSNRTLELQGCIASENMGVSRNCGAEKTIDRQWSAQIAVDWNGQDGGSGCTTVGGVRYCW